MVLAEAITALVRWAFGSVEGVSTVITLFFLAHYSRRGIIIGRILNNIGWFAMLLGGLVLLGVVDIHPGRLFGLAGQVFRLLAGVVA